MVFNVAESAHSVSMGCGEEELPLVVLSSLLASGLMLEQTWGRGSCKEHWWQCWEGQKLQGFLGAENVSVSIIE